MAKKPKSDTSLLTYRLFVLLIFAFLLPLVPGFSFFAGIPQFVAVLLILGGMAVAYSKGRFSKKSLIIACSIAVFMLVILPEIGIRLILNGLSGWEF